MSGRDKSSTPTRVRVATTLLYISLGVGALSFPLSPFWNDEEMVRSFIAFWLVAAVLLVSFYLALVVLMRRGYNWARWALLVLVGLGLFSVVLDGFDIEQGYAVAAIEGVSGLLATCAIYLLFSGASSQWFKVVRSHPTVFPKDESSG